jgi:hypothetical protein
MPGWCASSNARHRRPIRAPWTRTATVIPAGTTAAPICTIWIAAGEILGARLNTLHNLRFYQTLMADLRAAIAAGRLDSFAQDFLARQGG